MAHEFMELIKEDSDYDYIAIVPPNRMVDTGTEYRWNSLNAHIYNAMPSKFN